VGSNEQWPIPPAELGRRQAKALYEIEMLFREEGVSDFVYDEEKDLFRFPDGRFAFSRTHAGLEAPRGARLLALPSTWVNKGRKRKGRSFLWRRFRPLLASKAPMLASLISLRGENPRFRPFCSLPYYQRCRGRSTYPK
jgi:hypothetical protein